ncbi:radical SAM protein, partial [Candidatus Hydrogenedentota bacterium]
AAEIGRNGHDVGVIDRTVESCRHEVRDVKDLDRVTGELLVRMAPKLVGIASGPRTMADAIRVAQLCKRVYPSVHTFVWGIQPTIMPRQTLEECREFDFIVMGEPEFTISQLVTNPNLMAVSGLMFRYAGAYFATDTRKPVADLDELPMPDLSLMDMDYYLQPSRLMIPGVKVRGAPIWSSRGGKDDAGLLDKSAVRGRAPRFHSSERVVDEVKALIDQFDIHGFTFVDNLFAADKARVLEICEKLNSLDSMKEVIWCAYMRPCDADFEVLDAMKSAGCIQVDMRFLSGSQRILDSLNSGETVEMYVDAASRVKETGMRLSCRTFFKLPGENMDDVLETRRLIEKVRPHHVRLPDFAPMLDSEMFEQFVDEGKLSFPRHGHFTNRPLPLSELDNEPEAGKLEKIRSALSYRNRACRTKYNPESKSIFGTSKISPKCGISATLQILRLRVQRVWEKAFDRLFRAISPNAWRDYLESPLRESLREQVELFIEKHARGKILLDFGGAVYSFKSRDLPRGYVRLDINTANRPEICGDLESMPLKSGSVDAAICVDVLEHVRHPALAIEQMYDCMNEGGRLFVHVPFVHNVHAYPSDYHRFSAAGLELMLRDAGFSSIQIDSDPYTGFSYVLAHLYRFVWPPTRPFMRIRFLGFCVTWLLSRTDSWLFRDNMRLFYMGVHAIAKK